MKSERLLDVGETLTPTDHQTHRRYTFRVPERCERLELRIAYAPKRLDAATSEAMVGAAVRAQAARLEPQLAADWATEQLKRAPRGRIPNLLTISLDDASGAYRGAGHRQAAEQTLFISPDGASPGLVPGALPPGDWTITLSAHTLVSPQCAVSIQIGADVPTSTP